ncbi:PREDICTED: epididymal-specific lipocalin-8 [Odobenus rosmarus divergens]|uniref:Epididymal-specific lipocalin-8 n=1 Tax=Odobenus rosmarus divergens TaxID=9708 RepID=A0A2U3WU04_ODORO|nr:PREDICTED: epididymal-specific lipocalin-8 [Odobenus rosmarus divergens]
MEAGLLSAILGVVMVQGATAIQDLDLQKIAGFWREVGVASSQNLALKTPKRLEALFLTLSGHELIVKAAYNSSGSCETEKIVSSKIDVSGTFIFPGHREIHVIDTDYEQYAILRLSLHWQGKDYHVLKYFTRSLEDEYGPGFWRFREMTADTGLYLVARHGRCAKLLKEDCPDSDSKPNALVVFAYREHRWPGHAAWKVQRWLLVRVASCSSEVSTQRGLSEETNDAPHAQFSRMLLYMVPIFMSRLMGMRQQRHLLHGERQRGAMVVDPETWSSRESEAATDLMEPEEGEVLTEAEMMPEVSSDDWEVNSGT